MLILQRILCMYILTVKKWFLKAMNCYQCIGTSRVIWCVYAIIISSEKLWPFSQIQELLIIIKVAIVALCAIIFYIYYKNSACVILLAYFLFFQYWLIGINILRDAKKQILFLIEILCLSINLSWLCTSYTKIMQSDEEFVSKMNMSKNLFLR